MRFMKRMVAATLCGCALGARADVKMASLFTDNMVLQRDAAIPVWGTADAGENVTVTFAGQSRSAVAGADGRWSVKLDPVKASAVPAELKVQGRNALALKNVLVGEVWVCSGQSNMEMSVDRSNDAKAEIAAGNHPEIRGFVVTKGCAMEPRDAFAGAWQVCAPETVGKWSAAGYFFGRELNAKLNVPVGLIMTYWGGTTAQAWTPIDKLAARPELAGYAEDFNKVRAIEQKMPPAERAAMEQKSKAIQAEAAKRAEDPGNAGEKLGWQNPVQYTLDWEEVNVPNGWFGNNVTVYGSVWYRKDVELPESWAGNDLTLELGVVDDFDTAYFNGVKIGATGKETDSWWTVPRKYTVPAALVKPGKNTVAVRIFNDFGGGGFISPAGAMKVVKAGADPVQLTGKWLRKTELAVRTFPSLPSNNQHTPSVLYNAMIAPAVPYAIRGAIWYQGESNASKAYEYRTLFPAMIQAWREKWGQGDFPFYFVQLANFMAPKPQPGDSAWAELREAQTMTLALPNTGMAVIIDIGEEKDIHPKNKQDVGKRLALNALALTYGQKLEYAGPMYKGMAVEDGKVRVSFDHAGSGLAARGDGKLKGFAVCGADRVFVWADAVIDGSSVIVSSPSVKAPVAVRYDWADNPDGTLCNRDGLPASPFRTDRFPGMTEPSPVR